jgi:hypothetical protein
MCHFCHTLRFNLGARSHTKIECYSTRNPWSRNFDSRNYNHRDTLYALSHPPPDGMLPVPAARRMVPAPPRHAVAMPHHAVMAMPHHAVMAIPHHHAVMPVPRHGVTMVPIMSSRGVIGMVPLRRF